MKRTVKLLLIIIGFISLFIFSAPLIAGILNAGNLLGITISVIILIFGFSLDRIIELTKKLCSKRRGKIIFTTFTTAVISLGLCFFIALGSVIASSSSNAKDENTVIILGCAVYGEVPSIMLSARVNSAYNYLISNDDAVAVLSGGQGNGESISEAQCMYKLLTNKGIDGDRLFIEDKSTNTSENIRYSKEIIKKNNLSENVAIASSDYHLKRATMIAEREGLSAKRISSRSGFFDVPTFFFRDTIAVIKEFLLG